MNRWAGLASLTKAELLELDTDELVDEIERLRLDWYSPEEHERLVRLAEDEMAYATRYELLKDYAPLVDDADALLGDLAWRAVRGEADAIATEQIAGPILRRLALTERPPL